MIRRFFYQYRQILLYSFSLVVVLVLLQLLQYKLVLTAHAYELYILCIALLFTGLGIWLALKLVRPKSTIKTVVVEKPVYLTPNLENETALQGEMKARRRQHGLSSRETEVLLLMAGGLSNQEIADRLFLSVPTIKTHSSNLFEKLEVKRRTQAVEKARQLKLIA
ncbi:MAG TPA: response regulator transcription factor [Ferruginibacter sp.]|nr:response regulator transcription factor [Ferruginibacter sp.]HMP20906.1 response regulator transcription factor [Ferruginibacter sp.]